MTCTRCGEATDPNWYCSEGYCPACCVATDEDLPEFERTHVVNLYRVIDGIFAARRQACG